MVAVTVPPAVTVNVREAEPKGVTLLANVSVIGVGVPGDGSCTTRSENERSSVTVPMSATFTQNVPAVMVVTSCAFSASVAFTVVVGVQSVPLKVPTDSATGRPVRHRSRRERQGE